MTSRANDDGRISGPGDPQDAGTSAGTSTDARTEPRSRLSLDPRWAWALLPLIVAIGIATIASSGFRGQLAESFTRQAEPYVELTMDDSDLTATPTDQASCAVADSRLEVGFMVTNKLGDDTDLAYEVAVTDKSGARPPTAGNVALQSDGSQKVSETVRASGRAPFTVQVSLPGRPEKLMMRCSGKESGQ